MDSRPEQGVVRRLMWEAAAFGAAAHGLEEEQPAVAPPGSSPASEVEKARVPAGRSGPGSKIRRYVPERRPATPNPAEPASKTPVKPPD